MSIYLGNMSVKDIEREHGFEFSGEEREALKKTHHQNADFKDGETGWHMFDIPPFLVISNGPVGHKALDIFMSHNSDYRFKFQGGYGNSTEDTAEN